MRRGLVRKNGGNDLGKVTDLSYQTIVFLRRNIVWRRSDSCCDSVHGFKGAVRCGFNRTEEIRRVLKEIGTSSFRAGMLEARHWMAADKRNGQSFRLMANSNFRTTDVRDERFSRIELMIDDPKNFSDWSCQNDEIRRFGAHDIDDVEALRPFQHVRFIDTGNSESWKCTF